MEMTGISDALIAALRSQARAAPDSGIVDIMKYGRERGGVTGLWAGEGDTPTPPFIIETATRALAAGETFYTWQRGIPPLREALAHYHTRLYGREFSADEFFVTGSGMHAIQIALALTAPAESEVIIPTPSWPNAAGAAGILGARPVEVPMQFGNGGWTLDLERISSAINEKTRVLFVVTPSNPTGWTATHDDLESLLVLARQHGLWIIADETYARFWYGEGSRAPSFLDVMAPEDHIVFINTFSKNWCMTGWRMGWIKAHPSLGQVIENLIQYSNSGVAQFMQRAGVAALERGESFVAHQVSRSRKSRDVACEIIGKTGRCRFAVPMGAFYLFFEVEGESDTRALTRRLVDEAKAGLAPGTAFGAGGEHFVRLCFARDPLRIEEVCGRIAGVLEKG
jgi:aspartate/methionine/tyrosine aminotransferase